VGQGATAHWAIRTFITKLLTPVGANGNLYLGNLGMELKPLVLALLESGALYGYQLVERARQRGSFQWEEGTIYPLLHKMEQEGLLSSEWRSTPAGKKRRYYALTRKGKHVLERARVDWKAQARVISSILLGDRHGQPKRSTS
jgi:DNA-binding PadR family transcriptional regulator